MAKRKARTVGSSVAETPFIAGPTASTGAPAAANFESPLEFSDAQETVQPTVEEEEAPPPPEISIPPGGISRDG